MPVAAPALFCRAGQRSENAGAAPFLPIELVTHHVGGYLKIAPEHTEDAPLSKMMKPGIGTYEAFKAMFDRFSRQAGKKQYLIPYFIAAHPVQTFYPSPMSLATAMYDSGRDPLRKVSYKSQRLYIPKKIEQRRLHKAFLRYHDPKNWAYLRRALVQMKRPELIGDGEHQLAPAEKKTRRHTSPGRCKVARSRKARGRPKR